MNTLAEAVSNPRPRTIPATAVAIVGIAIGIAVATLWHSSRTDSLSVHDLGLALGIHHWRYTIPPNDGTQFLSFELRNDDGVKAHGGSSGWISGETIVVTVRPLMDSGKLECSCVGKKHHSQLVIDNPFAKLGLLVYADDGALVNAQPLIKGNNNGAVSNSSQPGDVTLRVVLKPHEAKRATDDKPTEK